MARRHYPRLWSVYVLLDPVTDIVRYVGCTESPGVRLQQHIGDGMKDRCKHSGERAKAAWVRGLLERGLEPEMSVRGTYTSRTLALSVEIALRHCLADTITNPPKNYLNPVRDRAVLMGLIYSLTDDLKSLARTMRRYSRKVRKAIDKEHMQGTADLYRYRAEAARDAIRLSPFSDRSTKKPVYVRDE